MKKWTTHIEFPVYGGEEISGVARKALILSLEHELPVRFVHNDKTGWADGGKYITMILTEADIKAETGEKT